MKKTLRLHFLISTLLLSGVASYGTTFDYQYIFANDLSNSGNPLTVSGTLDGTPNGIFIEGVSNVTLFFNGVQVTGPIYTATFNGSGWATGAIVSFDVLQNNFFFNSTTNFDTALPGSAEFIMLNYASMHIADGLLNGNIDILHEAEDSPPLSSSWSLGESNQGVSDGGMTASLLGVAFTFLAVLRRKLVHTCPPRS